jgi:hypothetical protein
VAFAQDADSRTLERGASEVVQVGPHDRYVVLDPDRIRVDPAGPEEIAVTALGEEGPAVVYVFTDAGPKSYVFWVRPPDETGAATTRAPGRDHHPYARREADFVYRAVGGLSGQNDSVVPHTGHQMSLSQEFDDTALEGNLAISGRQGQGWHVPTLHAGIRHQGLSFSLGDEYVVLAGGVGSFQVRGAAFEWSPDDGRSAIGAVAGPSRPTSCCAFVDPDGPTLAAIRGRYGWASESRASGVLGAVQDPHLESTLPLARVGVDHQVDRGTVAAEGFFAGEGGGVRGETRLAWERVSLDANMLFASRGLYLGRYVQDFDRLHGLLAPTVRLGDAWTLLASGSLGYTARPGGETRMSAGGRAGAYFLASPRDRIQGSYQYFVSWQDLDDRFERMMSRHAVELVSAHGTARGHRFANVFRARFDEQGLEGVQVTHRTELQGSRAWRYGLRAGASIGGGNFHMLLSGEVLHDGPRVYLYGRVGSTGGIGGPDKFTAGPVAGVQVGWSPVAEHRLGLDASAVYLTSSKSATWRASATYSFARGLVRRPDARAAGIAGSIRGIVYEDRDADGARDPEEPGLAGIPVALDGGRSVVTEVDGTYRFRAVVPGDHAVTIDRNGWYSVDGTRKRTDVRPLRSSTVDFALNSGRRILVRVFVDRDGNGVFSNGDRGIPAGAVLIRDAAEALVTTARAREGFADIGGLQPGFYSVTVDPLRIPVGYSIEIPTDKAADLERARTAIIDVPVRPLRAIGGTVYLDTARDGTVNGRDLPAADVAVTMSDGQQRLTDGQGRFLFRDLPEGRFEVEVLGATEVPEVRMENGPRDVLDLRILITDPNAIDRVLQGDSLLPDAGLPEQPTIIEEIVPELTDLRVEPMAAYLVPGETIKLRAPGTWSDGAPRQPESLTWSSSNPDVAEVDEAGIVTAHKFGFAEITTRAAAHSATMTVEVADLPLVGLELDPAEVALAPGEAVRLRVRAIYVDGRITDVSGDVRLRSEDESVAVVTSGGMVFATGPGETRVFAEFQGVTAFPTIVVVTLRDDPGLE